jgi:hypothetical protein
MSSHEQPRTIEALPREIRAMCFAQGCEQPRVAKPAGVAPSDARSIEQLRVTVSSQQRPRAARLYRVTASGNKPH